jgi:hypothetical protein
MRQKRPTHGPILVIFQLDELVARFEFNASRFQLYGSRHTGTGVCSRERMFGCQPSYSWPAGDMNSGRSIKIPVPGREAHMGRRSA